LEHTDPSILNTFGYIYNFCQENKVLVGVTLFASVLLVGYFVVSKRSSFDYEETINSSLKTHGENLLHIVEGSMEIVKATDINARIVDALLFSIMSTIQTLALQLPFEGGLSGKSFNDFYTRLSGVYKFVSKGKDIMDFLGGKEDHGVANFEKSKDTDPGYVLGHGEHHHPKCRIDEEQQDDA